MSYASGKGYIGEYGPQQFLAAEGIGLRRPRTTSRTGVDTGDLHGAPLVLSCKNVARMCLATWVDELESMVRRSEFETGAVLHKRARRGVRHTYVTTSLGLFVPLLRAYADTYPLRE